MLRFSETPVLRSSQQTKHFGLLVCFFRVCGHSAHILFSGSRP